METIKITIPLDPRTKKNHQMIAGSGRKCPGCGRALRLYIKQGKSYDAYSASAKWFLKGKVKEPIGEPCNVQYLFYMKTRRIVDLNGLIQAADDILVEMGILEDDNCRIVQGHDGTRVRYDKENPRTEISITPMEGN